MIPSLLQIPSAVSDSKLHSVLPNNGKGDFQFERSTGATRINRDGLIEEVGYFSSELVQNGNFSELGSELVTNGDFLTDSNWTKGSGWSILNGKAISDGSGNYQSISQSCLVSPIGKTYKVTYEVSDYVSGEVRCILGGFTLGQIISSNGLVTEYLTVSNASSNTFVYLETRGSGFTGKIDNISVKQVDPNDRWTITSNTGWNITDKANFDDSLTNNLYQTGLTLTSGKKYKLTFTISDASATALIWIGNSAGSVNYEGASYRSFTNGNHTIEFNMPSDQTTLAFFGNTGGSSFSLDNISLVEVQGDRPRLSYDITNGVVEDTPHLLLEPSATNLVTFSEDLSDWTLVNGTLTSNATVSPDGTQNADKVAFSSVGLDLKRTVTVVAGQTYTISFYIKVEEGTGLFNGRFYDNSNTTNIEYYDYADQIIPNQWSRITRSVTAPSGCTEMQIWLLAGSSTLITASFWGAQFEQQSYATSYIPTAGTTITRSGETCNNSKPSVNSTEGVLYCDIKALANDLTYRAVYINDNDATRYIGLRFSNNSNQLQAICFDGANLGFVSTTLSDITNAHKIALQYQSSGISLYVNGSLVGSDATFTGIAANQLDEVLFDSNSGTQGFYGKCKGLAVYNEALSESQLMQLTGVTASSIYNNFVTRTASFTVEALNEVKKVIDNL